MDLGRAHPPSVDQLARELQRIANQSLPLCVEAAKRVVRKECNGEWLRQAIHELKRMEQGHVRPAINATGVLLHTGLGRARLSDSAAAAVAAAASSHSTLEIDVETGERGDRQLAVRDYLCRLTGAESALVVNNCAAAVMLALSALARGKEVILSRGQMVEIGGSYRMPEIVEASGCRLREIGCTNKTHLRDYEAAIGPETGAILVCHRSNFSMSGFVSEPSIAEITALGKKHGIPVIDDLGSGCLVETTLYGLPHERTIGEAVSDCADLVLASGDKLLGGPQAGVIVGSKSAVETLRNHPMARALRIDKLCLAGLEATLRQYVAGEQHTIPVWAYAGRTVAELGVLAETLRVSIGGSAFVEECESALGGGSMPGSKLVSSRVGLRPENMSVRELAKKLREGEPPVFGRIEDDTYWLDVRTVSAEEIPVLANRVREAIG